MAAVGSGLLAGAVAAGLAGLTLAGAAALGAGLFAVQVVVALAWLAVLDARGGVGAFGIVVATAAVVDGVVAAASGPDLGRAAPVVGVVFAVCLLHQLSRHPRPGVVVSLAATLSAVAFVVCGAAYLALRADAGGDEAAAGALLGVGVALAVARTVDGFISVPAVAPGSRRGAPGIVAGLAAAAAVGLGYGSGTATLQTADAVWLALTGAALAIVADLAVDAVLTAAPPSEERPRSALAPLEALLPVILSGPAAYVAGRILLG
jgi:hypothetical protein